MKLRTREAPERGTWADQLSMIPSARSIKTQRMVGFGGLFLALAGPLGMVASFATALVALHLLGSSKQSAMVRKQMLAVTPREYARFASAARQVFQATGRRMPHVILLKARQANAGAARIGRGGLLLGTTALLDATDARGLRAILAHEATHYRKADSRGKAATTFGIAGLRAASFWSPWSAGWRGGSRAFIGALWSPAFLLLQGAALGLQVVANVAGRTVERRADRRGAEEVGDPLGLARALAEIEAYNRTVAGTGWRSRLSGNNIRRVPNIGQRLAGLLLLDHPRTEHRIRVLEKQASGGLNGVPGVELRRVGVAPRVVQGAADRRGLRSRGRRGLRSAAGPGVARLPVGSGTRAGHSASEGCGRRPIESGPATPT